MRVAGRGVGILAEDDDTDPVGRRQIKRRKALRNWGQDLACILVQSAFDGG